MLYAVVLGLAVVVVLVALLAQLVYPVERFFADLRFIKNKLDLMHKLHKLASAKPHPKTIVDVFERHARKTPDKTFLVYQDQTWSYAQVDRMANRVAQVGRKQGLKQRDTVALLIHNEPEFIWTFLGLAKLGVTCALLNYNLRSKSLLHCFEESQAKRLIVGPNLLEAVNEILPSLVAAQVQVWVLGEFAGQLPGNLLSMQRMMNEASEEPVARDAPILFKDPIAYVYTSGTTGLPKASRLSHYKLLAAGHLLTLFKMNGKDVFYITMPLYHISALFFGLGNAIVAGSTVVLRSKFSATYFWEDCQKHGVTVVLYIGELFRYLLARPERPEDGNNKVRLAVGNGLGVDIWQKVKNRYNIPRIVETYGATEGNFGMMNVDNKPGSVGCWSPLLRKFCPVELIKYNYESAEPIRDDQGRCIRVSPGEVGLLLCPVNNMFPLEGYVGNKEMTAKKIVKDVFKKGDIYFNTGDLFIKDKEHYYYFKDRLGDTFRWKGENVATTEVAQIINEYRGVQETVVYGVPVPGHYGRAGMAGIVVKPGHFFDVKSFYHYTANNLPSYARPRFIRLLTDIQHTSTFKQKKAELVQENFNPQLVGDPIFVMDSERETYFRMDTSIYFQFASGSMNIKL